MRKNNRSMILGFLFFAVICIAVGSVTLVKRHKYVPVQATIVSITSEYDSADDTTTHTTIATYTVDGKKYTEDIGYYQAGYKEGKEIEIRYNPEDPTQVEAASLGFVLYLLILGPILLAAAVIMFLRNGF